MAERIVVRETYVGGKAGRRRKVLRIFENLRGEQVTVRYMTETGNVCVAWADSFSRWIKRAAATASGKDGKQ